MAGAKVPLSFKIYKGDQLIREEKLSLSVIKLGKVPSAHLKLDDETVSRMHAIIEVNGPGDVSIIDLGSTKGTFVNGQKVNKAKLQSGDTIVVGETRIELTIGEAGSVVDDAPAAAPPPVAAPPAPPAFAQTMAAPPPAPARPAAPSFAAPPAAPSFAAPPAVKAPPGVGAPIFGTATASPGGFQTAMASEADDLGGARAVEVAAMLGDSVVTVKHCIDPKGGKVQGATWALFAIGLVGFLAFVASFYMAVDNAAYNKGKRDYETIVLKKPSFAVRDRQLPVGYDFIAFGGVIASLVTLTSAIARMKKEKQDPNFKIGLARDPAWFEKDAAGVGPFVLRTFVLRGVASILRMVKPDRGVDLPMEGAPSVEYPLVQARGDDFVLNAWPGLEGEMIVNGQSTPLPQGSVPIPSGAKIRVRSGKTTFLVSSVPRPRRHVMPLFAALESRVLAYFAGSLTVHLGFWLLLQQIPVEDSGTNIDLASLEDTSTRSNSTNQDDPPPPEEEEKPDDGNEESGGSGTAMTLDEGKMGKKDSTRAEGQYKMQKTSEDPQLARQQAIEQARNAGILGSSALVQGGAFASLTGTGDISSGFDDSNIYGGLLGNEAGEMNGGFGFGRSGFGPGGGGTGWGTIGTGRYGTIGHGSGTGSGYGVGGGRGGMRGRSAAVPTVSIGQPNAQGDLDKAIIRRYIKRNIQKITYCYEKELLAKPGLAGTVSTQFFITPNGNVATASGSGVDPSVANCVADVIKGIEFPKPKGGGGVQVNYPFTFRPAG